MFDGNIECYARNSSSLPPGARRPLNCHCRPIEYMTSLLYASCKPIAMRFEHRAMFCVLGMGGMPGQPMFFPPPGMPGPMMGQLPPGMPPGMAMRPPAGALPFPPAPGGMPSGMPPGGGPGPAGGMWLGPQGMPLPLPPGLQALPSGVPAAQPLPGPPAAAPSAPAAGPSASGAPASGAPKSDWTEHTAPDGRKYFYNSRTKQSSWERPAELMSQQARMQQQQLPYFSAGLLTRSDRLHQSRLLRGAGSAWCDYACCCVVTSVVYEYTCLLAFPTATPPACMRAACSSIGLCLTPRTCFSCRRNGPTPAGNGKSSRHRTAASITTIRSPRSRGGRCRRK